MNTLMPLATKLVDTAASLPKKISILLSPESQYPADSHTFAPEKGANDYHAQVIADIKQLVTGLPNSAPLLESRENQQLLVIVKAVISAIHVEARGQYGIAVLFLTAVEQSGLSHLEREIISREFRAPTTPQGLAKLISTPELAALIYTLSHLIITTRSAAATSYLARLAHSLGLPAQSWASLQPTAARHSTCRASGTFAA